LKLPKQTNYVFHPYQLVKDLRNLGNNCNTDVMNGEIDLNSSLLRQENQLVESSSAQ